MIDLNDIPEEISVDTAMNIMEGVGVSWQQWNYFIDDCDIQPEACLIYGSGIRDVPSEALLRWLRLS